ncbi:MAG: hypothetical protein RR382_01675, partial [Tannerellaceae bacterium]
VIQIESDAATDRPVVIPFFEIVCIGIHNKRGDMPVWFREVLKDNCTWQDFCNEAFGYTHEQTLDSSLVLILAMLREHGYLVNERNRSMYPDSEGEKEENGEWVYRVDFETGKKVRVRKRKFAK